MLPPAVRTDIIKVCFAAGSFAVSIHSSPTICTEQFTGQDIDLLTMLLKTHLSVLTHDVLYLFKGFLVDQSRASSRNPDDFRWVLGRMIVAGAITLAFLLLG